LAFIILLGIAAILADFITLYSPIDANLAEKLTPPSGLGGSLAHPLGTDNLGRDIFSRLIFGARYSLMVAFVSIIVTGLLGAALGLISGYYGGIVGAIIMRATDAALALPVILTAMLLAVVFGPSFLTLIVALIVAGWAQYARLIRGEVLSLKERDFVAQARTIGCSGWTIMLRHLFPNIVNTLVVLMTLRVGLIIIFESTLSFLGCGIPPPTPSWGRMVSDGRLYMVSAWWVSFIPAMIILFTVLSFNLLGDWLRDRLDPKLRQI
jgi:peptide/nickel transport system permease protein